MITYHNKGLERILTPNKSCVVTTRTTIIDTIKNLLNDKDRVTEIGNNAHNEIKRFSFENLMLKYWEVGSNS